MKYLQHKSGDGRLSCEEYRKSKKVLYLRHKSCDGSLSLKRRGGAPHWRQLGPEIEREKILPTLSFATISTPTFLLFFAAETLKEIFRKLKGGSPELPAWAAPSLSLLAISSCPGSDHWAYSQFDSFTHAPSLDHLTPSFFSPAAYPSCNISKTHPTLDFHH